MTQFQAESQEKSLLTVVKRTIKAFKLKIYSKRK